MAGRRVSGRPPASKHKTSSSASAAKKSIARSRSAALDAFAIAEKQVEDGGQAGSGGRRLRGEAIEGEKTRGRRGRGPGDQGEEEDDGDDGGPGPKKRAADDSDPGGSDGDIAEWQAGDEDEEIDSDDAFGESDEERFAGFAFRGSRKNQKAGAGDEGGEDEEDLESLGSDAIDLATALDQWEEDGEEDGEKRSGVRSEEEPEGSASSPSDDDDGRSAGRSSEDDDDIDDDDDDDDDDRDDDDRDDDDDDDDRDADHDTRVKSLQGLVSGFADQDKNDDAAVKTSRQKINLGDLGLAAVRDVHMRRSVKLMSREEKEEARPGTAKKRRLDVPLARRQRDRLHRAVAYEKANDTLDRWNETVQRSRRAEHLVFPLPQNVPSLGIDTTELPVLDLQEPANELEQTIATIMEQSGLSLAPKPPPPTPGSKDPEDGAASARDLNRRRLRRELNSREAVRASRLKKIKSKAFNRVRRRARQRLELAEQEAHVEAGEADEDEEREAYDRRRALERVGARHRESKWAKAGSGIRRAAWDDDYRAGITDMARREKELLRRKEGRAGSCSGDDESDDDHDETESDVGESEGKRLKRKLERAAMREADEKEPYSKLMSLQFMRRAEERLKRENDELAAQIGQELLSDREEGESGGGGGGSGGEDESVEVGRKQFGLKAGGGNIGYLSRRSGGKGPLSGPTGPSEKITSQAPTINTGAEDSIRSSGNPTGGAWSNAATGESRQKRKRDFAAAAAATANLDLNAAIITAETRPRRQQSKAGGDGDNAGSDSDEAGDGDGTDVHLPLAIRDQDLVARAFASEDVVAAFAAEKAQVMSDEDDKLVDTSLPGWGGSWIGSGIKKRKRRPDPNDKWVKKVEGVKKTKRQDAKLEKVIINEKRVKKNDRYLATQLPYPFETRQQYERSLRVPIGQEWVTKESFQDAIKPRVLLKHGVIEPISKPTG